MQTKLQITQEILQKQIEKLWTSKDEYRSFLKTSSRLYKYSFKDQALIHAQRPDAVACAEFDTWSKENLMNRYIKRGSKGIALLTETNGYAKLRYVFDYTDTGARDERSKEPFFWQITDKNEQAVISSLGTRANDTVSAILEKAAQAAREYSDNYMSELLGSVQDTFLEDLDELNISVEFERLLDASVAYAVLERCGYDAESIIDEEDFSKLYEFNSIEAMSVLGNAVSDLSEQILRNIERTVKVERSKENERNNDITRNNDGKRDNVPSGRDNTDLSAGLGAAGTEAYREVRTSPARLPEEEPESNVSGNAPEGNAERSPVGNGRNSEPPLGRDNAEIGEVSRSDGEAESRESDEVGRLDEHAENTGRGSHTERTDILLNGKTYDFKAINSIELEHKESAGTPDEGVGVVSFHYSKDDNVVYRSETNSRTDTAFIPTEVSAYDAAVEIQTFINESNGDPNNTAFVILSSGAREYLTEEAVPEISDAASSLDKAKELISEYIDRVFEAEADFSDLSRVPLAFTTDEESEEPIDVFADLSDYRIVKMYGNEVAEEINFGSIEKMLPVLANLDFDELVVIDKEAEKTLDIPDETLSSSFSEEQIANILKSYNYMHVSKYETLEFFLNNPDSAARIDFLKDAFNDDYSELIINRERYGYKKYDEGLEIWKGSYLSATPEKISWATVQDIVGRLIEDHSFLDEPNFLDIEPDVEEAGGYSEPAKKRETGQLSFFDDGDVGVFEEPETDTREQLSSITPDMVDYALRSGGNEPDSVLRIIAQFQKHRDISENAAFLRDEFAKGFSKARGYMYESPDGLKAAKVSAVFEQDGITLGIGNTAKNYTSVSLTWEQVAKRIGELLDDGVYASQQVINAALPYEIKVAADALWELNHDLEYGHPFFIPEEMFYGGHPDSTARIQEALKNPDTVGNYVDELKALDKEYQQNRDIMRFHFYKPSRVLGIVKELQCHRTEYKAAADYSFSSRRFITEDNKNDAVLSGTGYRSGKFEVLKFFSEPHTKKERADYLKKKSGIYSGFGSRGVDITRESKGITFSLGEKNDSFAEVHIKWTEAADIVSKQIAQGLYITQDDINEHIIDCKDIVLNRDGLFSAERIAEAKAFLEKHGVEIPDTAPAVTEEEPEISDTDEITDDNTATENEPAADMPENDEAETPELSVVKQFRAKTDEKFHSLKGADTAADIEDIVRFHAEQVLAECGMDAEVVDVALIGSRCRGLENDKSDIDVVVEINGAMTKMNFSACCTMSRLK